MKNYWVYKDQRAKVRGCVCALGDGSPDLTRPFPHVSNQDHTSEVTRQWNKDKCLDGKDQKYNFVQTKTDQLKTWTWIERESRGSQVQMTNCIFSANSAVKV